MTIERTISLFGIDKLSVSRPVSPNHHEDLIYSLLTDERRRVIVQSEEEIRVHDTDFSGHVLHDKTLKGPEITKAKIDNSHDGVFGKILRISYVWKPTQNNKNAFSEAEIA